MSKIKQILTRLFNYDNIDRQVQFESQSQPNAERQTMSKTDFESFIQIMKEETSNEVQKVTWYFRNDHKLQGVCKRAESNLKELFDRDDYFKRSLEALLDLKKTGSLNLLTIDITCTDYPEMNLPITHLYVNLAKNYELNVYEVTQGKNGCAHQVSTRNMKYAHALQLINRLEDLTDKLRTYELFGKIMIALGL